MAGIERKGSIDDLCPACKRNGRVFCPHSSSLFVKAEVETKLSENMAGPSPPNMFIGTYGYPNISAGPMISIGASVDDPAKMYGMEYQEIIRQRSNMVIGRQAQSIFSRTRKLGELQDAIMSTKDVDMEAVFREKPRLSLSMDNILQPMGPTAALKDFSVIGNPAVPRVVDQIRNDNILAVDALSELTGKGFDSHYLTKLLSAGILGRREQKKMVPTRWAITATDDMVGKQMLEKVRLLPQAEEFMVFSTEYLFNHFEVIVLPGAFEFEQFEAWMGADPKYASISEEYEGFEGRTAYAFTQGGGYYACRFGVAWGLLNALKMQGRVTVIREILPDYTIPVGVWEVRENARHAMMKKPFRFDNLKAALDNAFTRLKVPRLRYLEKTRILRQSKISDFLR
ncbi:MAG: hypothetical protein WC506_01120 [Candidatus Micrarchaeia archaeon]